jgi:hypothetical protein
VFLNFFSIQTILIELARKGHPVNPGALTEEELRREPDIANTSIMDLFEIRPENQLGEAAARAAMFVALFRRANAAMMLGPMTDPGVTGQLPAPAGVVQFWSAAPGVILYCYRKMAPVPVPVPVPVPELQDQKNPSGIRFELEPVPEVAPEALLPGTAGALMLILMMILLAPVGV